VLVAVIKKRLKIAVRFHTILQILSLINSEQTKLNQWIENSEHNPDEREHYNQLNLFN